MLNDVDIQNGVAHDLARIGLISTNNLIDGMTYPFYTFYNEFLPMKAEMALDYSITGLSNIGAALSQAMETPQVSEQPSEIMLADFKSN